MTVPLGHYLWVPWPIRNFVNLGNFWQNFSPNISLFSSSLEPLCKLFYRWRTIVLGWYWSDTKQNIFEQSQDEQCRPKLKSNESCLKQYLVQLKHLNILQFEFLSWRVTNIENWNCPRLPQQTKLYSSHVCQLYLVTCITCRKLLPTNLIACDKLFLKSKL